MPTIPNTLLGTSDDASICKGFALFPALGSARAGVQLSDQTKTLVDAHPQILLWKFSCNAGYQLVFGVCGPAYGIKFDISGDIPGDSSGDATFTLSNDNVQAGFFLGAKLRLFFNVKVERLNTRFVADGWDTRIETYWEESFDTSLEFTIDLIALALDLIRFLLKGKAAKLDKVSDFAPSLQGSWGLLDGSSGDFSEKGTATVNPALDFPINLVSLIPAFKPVVEALEKLAGGVEAGPTIALVIPVTVTLKSITVTTESSTHTYEPVNSEQPATDGKVKAKGEAGFSGAPHTIGATLEHSPGFDIKVGVYFKIFVLKLFEFNNATGFNLLEALNIRPTLGTHDNTVSNTVGAQSTGRATILPQNLSRAVEDWDDTSKVHIPRVAFRPRATVGAAG